MKRLVTSSALLSALLLAACGDDKGAGTSTDAAVTPDSTADIDGGIDGAPAFVKPTPFLIDISPTGPDQLMSVAAGPNGSFYAAGYAAVGAAGAKYLIVVKLTSAGVLDTTFGTGGTGIYTSTLEFKGGSDEIDVAVQSDGKIVVAGTIANSVNAADRDIGLFRVDATGALDTTFGIAANGTAVLNLSTAFVDTNNGNALKALDSQRGLAVGPNDQLFIHAASRNDLANGGLRDDTDFTVARLSAAGVLDTNYGTLGKHLLDLNETDKVATAKGLGVLADGTVIAGGYAKTAVSPATGQPVLYRLTPAGALDTAAWSGNGGVFNDVVLTLQTEIYAFAIDNNHITTAGYGRETGTGNVWASLRFNLMTGARDTNFGNASNGAVLIDPTGAVAGSNCRNAIALEGGKTALLGSAGPGGSRDAAFAILTQNGQLDTSYGTGVHTFDLTGTEDQWWGGAVNGGKLLLTGWRGVGATQADGANLNDNSFGVLVELQ